MAGYLIEERHRWPIIIAVLKKFRIWKERHVQMKENGAQTHDIPHTVATNMVSHALTHSATAEVFRAGEIYKAEQK